MKTIIIVRHAKAGEIVGIDDFERPLTERGKQDAKTMAAWLSDVKLKPEIFIASGAKRTRQTAKRFLKAFGKKKKKLVLTSKLYHAPASVYYEVLAETDDSIDSVAIFGHNGGITDFVNSLQVHDPVEMRTCALFAVAVRTKHWSDIAAAKKDFLFYHAPSHEG